MNTENIENYLKALFELTADSKIQVMPQENGSYKFLIETAYLQYSHSDIVQIKTMSHENGLCIIVGEYKVDNSNFERVSLKEALKKNIEKQATKGLDEKYLISRGQGGKSYTFCEVLHEIEQETPFGVGLIRCIFNLALNLLTRGKEELCEDYNIGRIADLETWEQCAVSYYVGKRLPELQEGYKHLANEFRIEFCIYTRKWAVRLPTSTCLSKGETGEPKLVREPIPSSRTPEFLALTRFDSKEEAFECLLRFVSDNLQNNL